MFNLIFEELMVSVLSHRPDTTAHPQEWQGVRGSQGMGCALLTAPWSQESQTRFGARQLSQDKFTHKMHFPGWGSLCHIVWDYVHFLPPLWSETLTALWEPPPWWLISVIYSALSKPHPATACSWIPSPWGSALVKSSGGKISWIKLLTCDCKAFSVIEKNTGWMNELKWAGY